MCFPSSKKLNNFIVFLFPIVLYTYIPKPLSSIYDNYRRFTVQYGNIFGRVHSLKSQYDFSSCVRVQIYPVLYSKTSYNLFILHLINETWLFKRLKTIPYIFHIVRSNFIKFYISLIWRCVFSSPEHEVLKWAFVILQCPASVVRRPSVRACVRACVNNFFKRHLLWNRLLDFDQTSQEWSPGGPLSKLFKPFQLVA